MSDNSIQNPFDHWMQRLREHADGHYHRRGYAHEHKAFRHGGEFILSHIEEIFEHFLGSHHFCPEQKLLLIGISQLKIKGAFMQVQLNKSKLADSGDGVKFISGPITPETDKGDIEKVHDGSVIATSNNPAVVVTLDPEDQLKYKATVDLSGGLPIAAKLSFSANADLVDGGTVDNITGEIDILIVEDEATKLVIGVDQAA